MTPANTIHCSEALDLLNEISGSILEKHTRDDVLNDVIERVADTFGAQSGSIAVPDSNEEYLEYVAEYNRDPEHIDCLNESNPLEINQGVAGHAYANRRIYAVEDVYESEIFRDPYYEHARKEGFQAILSVPLIAFDDCLGAVSLYYETSRTFGETIRQTLDSVSNQVAMALLHANLLEELEATNERLRELSQTDELTGLLNHRAIRNRLSKQFQRATAEQHSLSVILADIDHFKHINDRHGHTAGDRVLERLGELFRAETRSDDLTGRDGGEEFLIALPRAGAREAADVAHKFRESVENLSVNHEGQSVTITISLGVATFDGMVSEVEEFIKRADEALYRAKETGRNRAVHYKETPGNDHAHSDTPSVENNG